MSRELVFCQPWEDLAAVEDRLIRFRKSRVVGVDDECRLVGILSLSDIALREPPWRAGEVLRGIAERQAAVH